MWPWDIWLSVELLRNEIDQANIAALKKSRTSDIFAI